MDLVTFCDSMKKQGFDQVVEVVWKPLTTVEEHSDPFDAKAVVVLGEMWLTANGHTEHLLPSGTFELPANLPHSERYGPAGTIYWVARRKATAPGH